MSDDMREAFEKWAKDNNLKMPEKGRGYHVKTHYAWVGYKAAIQSLPRVTEAELAETIYNDVYDSNFDISRLAANILAKYIAAKFPQIIAAEKMGEPTSRSE